MLIPRNHDSWDLWFPRIIILGHEKTSPLPNPPMFETGTIKFKFLRRIKCLEGLKKNGTENVFSASVTSKWKMMKVFVRWRFLMIWKTKKLFVTGRNSFLMTSNSWWKPFLFEVHYLIELIVVTCCRFIGCIWLFPMTHV